MVGVPNAAGNYGRVTCNIIVYILLFIYHIYKIMWVTPVAHFVHTVTPAYVF